MSKGESSMKPFERRFNARRQEYQDYLPLTERAQEALREDIEELKAQEGWDISTCQGVDQWADDKDSIFRALRRNRWDESKTHKFLLSVLMKRITLGLNACIPTTSIYYSSPLFQILPLPEFTDRLNRPIAVISLSQVRRDENGSLDELKEWTWWALEMVRRVLQDWWVNGKWTKPGEQRKRTKRGYGGEGCVMIVDAKGAGYRNLEVELLPTLLSVGHDHFPGLFEAVYVVNAGWTHRSMWGVVKRVLPKSAIEKMDFLDNQAAIEEIFDPKHLPKAYGGKAEYKFDQEDNPILRHYSIPTPPKSATLPPQNASRSASTLSIADVYYTAQNTPYQSRAGSRVHSRRTSRRGSMTAGIADGLRMTDLDRFKRSKSATTLSHRHQHQHQQNNGKPEEDEDESARSPFEDQFTNSITSALSASRKSSRRTSRRTSPAQTPLQRIKSLSNFHLYLSPSRLAHLDLLSDSDPEDEVIKPVVSSSPNIPPPRRILQPVDPDQTLKSIAARRERPPLRLLGGIGKGDEPAEAARSYSDRLGLHHAKILEEYRKTSPPASSPSPTIQSVLQAVSPSATTTAVSNGHVSTSSQEKSEDIPDSAQPAVVTSPESSEPSSSLFPDSAPAPAPPDTSRSISAFSRSSNPWFGYPAIIKSGTIIPRYPRRRKRDLVKTLLFLFMLRLQSLRDTFERYLGLNRLGSWNLSLEKKRDRLNNANTPDMGLVVSADNDHKGLRNRGRRSNWERDWIWWVIGVMVLRGTWLQVIAAPLEALGLENIRDLFGLGG